MCQRLESDFDLLSEWTAEFYHSVGPVAWLVIFRQFLPAILYFIGIILIYLQVLLSQVPSVLQKASIEFKKKMLFCISDRCALSCCPFQQLQYTVVVSCSSVTATILLFCVVRLQQYFVVVFTICCSFNYLLSFVLPLSPFLDCFVLS